MGESQENLPSRPRVRSPGTETRPAGAGALQLLTALLGGGQLQGPADVLWARVVG